MWICLNNAFLSIVDKAENKANLLVRARRKGDIKRVFPNAIERHTRGTDYAYRADIKREDVALTIAHNIDEINYDNFKNSVEDHQLHNAYAKVWGIMANTQVGGAYGYADDEESYEH